VHANDSERQAPHSLFRTSHFSSTMKLVITSLTALLLSVTTADKAMNAFCETVLPNGCPDCIQYGWLCDLSEYSASYDKYGVCWPTRRTNGGEPVRDLTLYGSAVTIVGKTCAQTEKMLKNQLDAQFGGAMLANECECEASFYPTRAPTSPTKAPTTPSPTSLTSDPTVDPTIDPTRDPTSDPTVDPTSDPTNDPTRDPSADPTSDPTRDPTNDPSSDPTSDPSADPTMEPTSQPTQQSTNEPFTELPTMDPTDSLSEDGDTGKAVTMGVHGLIMFVMAVILLL